MAEALPDLLVPDVDAWRQWLTEHADESNGVRLVLAKKGTTTPTSLSYAQALMEALCHGWIDGQSLRRDDTTWYQRFTPRRARSIWSQRNVQYVAELTEQGRMQARGLAEVAKAKADGRWAAAYAGPAGIETPAELTAALAADAQAQATWDGLSSQNRYAILHRLATLKRAETRTRRIGEFVAMLARGETPYPQKPRRTDGAPGTPGQG